MEILSSLKDGFVKFTYESACLHTFYFKIKSLLVEKYLICMNSKDFKTELGGQ